eukprot:613578-Heterocapsa_arctica.AAC.1
MSAQWSCLRQPPQGPGPGLNIQGECDRPQCPPRRWMPASAPRFVRPDPKQVEMPWDEKQGS